MRANNFCSVVSYHALNQVSKKSININIEKVNVLGVLDKASSVQHILCTLTFANEIANEIDCSCIILKVCRLYLIYIDSDYRWYMYIKEPELDFCIYIQLLHVVHPLNGMIY